jgi:hypothetical protein
MNRTGSRLDAVCRCVASGADMPMLLQLEKIQKQMGMKLALIPATTIEARKTIEQTR